MHINVSAEQHTHSIKQLLKNLSTNPVSVKELGQWGLEIGSQILRVSLSLLSNIIALCIHVCHFSALCFNSVSIISFCRFKVELYLLKLSTSSLRLVYQAQISPGPEMLSGKPQSALWGTVSSTNPSQNLDQNLTVWIHFYSVPFIHCIFRFPSVPGPSSILAAVQSRLRSWLQP